jgi:D-alanyl-D-alanine carboxypeptidase/D-alanyl-D-alanine-endopeptidase (penicillin-binding protein 4)
MRRLVLSWGMLVVLFAAAPAVADAQSTSAIKTLTTALNRGMRDIGGASSAYVVDLQTGQALYSDAAATGRLPASVEKIYTTSTALLRMGPTATLSTTVLGVGQVVDHTWDGTLYLRGGGDPTFGSAGFDRLNYGTGATIQQLATNLIRSTGIRAVEGRVIGDESYFDSLRGTSESGFQFDPDMTGALSAVAFNRGLADDGNSYIFHPAIYAAQQLVLALRADGVKVPKGIPTSAGRTPQGAAKLASVSSPKLSTLIALTNAPSDNFFAEMLLKGLGARYGGAGTTTAGAAVVRSELASQFGVDPQLVDGSGLSRADSTTPVQVVTVLSKMYSNPYFFDSLAVAGETGTLQDEGQGTRARGNCRGKTGTLHDVANLAGYCQARDGQTLVFAFLANSLTDPDYVHEVEGDDMAPALANYDG